MERFSKRESMHTVQRLINAVNEHLTEHFFWLEHNKNNRPSSRTKNELLDDADTVAELCREIKRLLWADGGALAAEMSFYSLVHDPERERRLYFERRNETLDVLDDLESAAKLMVVSEPRDGTGPKDRSRKRLVEGLAWEYRSPESVSLFPVQAAPKRATCCKY